MDKMVNGTIFNIGLGKTGTVTLSDVINQLGVRSQHDHRRSGKLVRLLAANELKKALSLLREDNVTVWFDANFYDYTSQILEIVPDARFIQTTREFESWIISRMIHVLYNRVTKHDPWCDIDTEDCCDLHKKVTKIGDDLISQGHDVFRVNVVEEREKCLPRLCKFLNVEIPDQVKWPVLNTGLGRLEEMAEIFRERC